MNYYKKAIDYVKDLSDYSNSELVKILSTVAKESPSVFVKACEENTVDPVAAVCRRLYISDKLAAIKHARNERGLSLQDAKEWVESLK